MERRRKKPDRKVYRFRHRGRHGDQPVLEDRIPDIALYGSESNGETLTPLPDTLTLPEHRSPLWVTLSVLGVAVLVVAVLAIGSGNHTDFQPTEKPAVAGEPERAEPAPTVTVQGRMRTITVRVPVPGPTVTVTPSPVPGPTVTVTQTVTPKPSPAVTVTVTSTVTKEVPVPGPTVTVTASPDLGGLLP